MAGTPGRSGGKNRKNAQASTVAGDGKPELPRKLSDGAKKHYDWLCERLKVNESGPWRRVDGVLLASLAETMEGEETVSRMLEIRASGEYLRLRLNYATQIARLSGLIGLCPRDRERLQTAEIE